MRFGTVSQAFHSPKLALLACVAAANLLISACGSSPSEGDAGQSSLAPEVTTPVAAAEDAGLNAYWLGPSFDAAGYTFSITESRLEAPEEGPSVQVSYRSRFEGSGWITFSPATYSVEAWDAAKLRGALTVSSVTSEHVTILGWPAELLTIPTGRFANRFVIVQRPEAVIVVPATAAYSTDGRQVNPLNDPDVLLAVLEENLRPYPD